MTKVRLALNLLFGIACLSPAVTHAQTRAETLRHVSGNTVNTLDPSTPGATRESIGLSVSVYDRLVTFDRKLRDGVWVFDPAKIRGELAQSYEISPDGLTLTFHLRDAKWHDGAPVTADDVKWSLDRAVSAKSLSAGQMAVGSLTKPEQFKIVDDHTITVNLPQPDRLGLADLATPLAPIFNSKLAKQHATPDDPWAQDWLKSNIAAGGAYTVGTFKPGEQIILRRNDNWANGKLPYFKRVIEQKIPDVATRANLVEKGDADVAVDLQASDVQALAARGKVRIDSTPQTSGFTMIAFNTQLAPFDNLKVRLAIAAALPYDSLFAGALFKRGLPLTGASWTTPPTGAFPQAMPVTTDLEKARRLLTEAGFPHGFKTSFTINVGLSGITEPMAALIKEQLAKLEIDVDIQKLPDSQMATAIAGKTLPFFTEASDAWLSSPDYFFRVFFTGNSRWNYASWNNAEVADLANKARYLRDSAAYDDASKRMISDYLDAMPLVLLWQSNIDAVMAPDIEGYTYWFHRQLDFRDLKRKS